MGKRKRIAWHPGFYGGLEFDLRKYRDILIFEQEHELSKEPLRMDLIIIKKKDDVEISLGIGRIFRRHNIIEYKSPHDDLSIDDLYKVIAYACLYKSLGNTVDEIKANELSISVFRHNRPRKLFSVLRRLGAVVDRVYEGVYYINGIINIPLQLIVIAELPEGESTALKVLTPNADEADVWKFVESARNAKVPGDRRNADAVLQVSVSANQDLYDRIREETEMCDALRELMKDEIEKDKAEARREGFSEGHAEGRAEGENERRALSDENVRLRKEIANLRAAMA